MIRPPIRLSLAAAFAITWAASLAAQAPVEYAPGTTPPIKTAADFAGATPHRVVRVVDGDTVVLAIEGRDTTVRLIGVDTPEMVHPSKAVERFGKEASAFLKGLGGGKSVYLDYEASGRTDKYGRTLAYLHTVPDAELVNLEIVAKGYGHAYTTYPFRYMETFRGAEREARAAGLGLWAARPDPAVARASTERVGAPGAPLTQAVPAKEAGPDATTVYVTRTGEKYHAAGCRYLARSSTPIPLGQAVGRYSPCSKCRPPRVERGLKDE